MKGSNQLNINLLYYPFGVTIKERTFAAQNTRYQFNGKEYDNETETSDFGARNLDGDLGVWGALDPLANKYPDYSPYNFTANNPILYIDPNGKEVYIYGEDAKETVAALQTKTTLELKYDVKTNQLIAIGKPKTALDKKFLQALKDPKIKVKFETSRENIITSKSTGTKGYLVVGAFDGSVLEKSVTDGVNSKLLPVADDGTGGIIIEESVTATQIFNINHAKIEEEAGGRNPGAKSPISGEQSDEDAFMDAHSSAASLDKDFKESTPSTNPKAGPGEYNVNGKNIDVHQTKSTPDEK
jgi:RHS repeat-associated protein